MSREKRAALAAKQILDGHGATAGHVLTKNSSGPSTYQEAGGSSAPFADTTELVKGSGDDTKRLRFEVDGFTTGTTRVITPADRNQTYTTPTTADADADVMWRSSAATKHGLVVQATASQSVALQEWQESDGGIAASITVDDSTPKATLRLGLPGAGGQQGQVELGNHATLVGTSARGLQLSPGVVNVGDGSNVTIFAIVPTDTFEAVRAASDAQYGWTNSTTDAYNNGNDTGLKRAAAKQVALTDGSTGGGALRLLNMTAPTAATGGGHIYAKATGNGEIYTLDGDGNEALQSPHYIQGYIDAGGTLLPPDVDPMPQISYECNRFIGKEILTYRLKRELAVDAGQPVPADWRIVRDLPAHERLDWDENQKRLAMEHADAAIERMVSAKNAARAKGAPAIKARDLTADEVLDCYASYNFAPRPAWMSRASETAEQRQGRMAALVNWVLKGLGLR